MKQYLTSTRKRRLLSGAAILIIAASGIYEATKGGDSIAAVAPAATPVKVQTLAKQDVRVWNEFSGRLHAVDSAEIRPEVSGRITELRFAEGQNVKAGDVLFVIDPKPYEAAVARAEANLASARTNASFADVEQKRAAGMIKTQAIAKRLYDERANTSRVANASVKAAEAELQQARIDLDHAYVKAPIDGRVSRAEITVGNLVQASNAPLLTTVVSSKNIYADFEVDEQTYLQTIRGAAGSSNAEQKIPVEIALQGDADHPYKGTIDSFDNRIDVTTGTIRARAKFANTDGVLVPGMFVSVKLASGANSNALMVPDRAIGFDQSKKFVYIVDTTNKVVYREVQLGQQVDSKRIVLSGLEPGERIIVDGLSHVRPDAVVAPTEATETIAAR